MKKKEKIIYFIIIITAIYLFFLLYNYNIEYFKDIKKESNFDKLFELPILDAIFRYDALKKYFSDINIKPQFDKLLSDKVNIVDDYRNNQTLFKLNDIKFKIKYNPRNNKNYIISCLGIDTNNKIINITNKYLSYWAILNTVIDEDAENLFNVYNELVKDSIYQTINEDVFLFFDCFAYAPVHNLDDIYNSLYVYKKNNLKCKLLVIKTTNFYYNQILISLNKYFNLEYLFIDFDKTYLFKNLYCTRQYVWLQKDSREFINKEYINKIIEDNKNKPYHDNISIIKYIEPTNVSTYDTFEKSERFDNFCKKYNIIDINVNYKEDLEYKIYLINKAKKIITNYFSPYNVNIYKHCIDFNNKEIFVINGGTNPQFNNIDMDFEKIGENTYNTYGKIMKGEVLNNINNLDELVDKLEKYFK